VRVLVMKGGKPKGSRINAAHLNTMLGTETFLGQFRRVDLVTTTPAYLPDFTLTQPGLNEGDGQRILYVGPEPVIADYLDAISAFLGKRPAEPVLPSMVAWPRTPYDAAAEESSPGMSSGPGPRPTRYREKHHACVPSADES
jgi:hypothetical protein